MIIVISDTVRYKPIKYETFYKDSALYYLLDK